MLLVWLFILYRSFAVEEKLLPITTEEIVSGMELRKHGADAKTRKGNRAKTKARPTEEAMAAFSQYMPLTEKDLDSISMKAEMARKAKVNDGVPIEEQRRIGDLVRAKQREIDLEKASVAFGLADYRDNRRELAKHRQPCATPGCPHLALEGESLCRKCKIHNSRPFPSPKEN